MKQTVDYLNAYTFGFCEKRGFTKGDAWKRSLEEMVRTTGCNAIILPVCAWQDHAYSTEMESDTTGVMSREDVQAVCAYARSLGLKIILKAMVNCRDGYWRAYIRFFDTDVPCEPKWKDWFASWGRHVCLVADMAEENKADLYCIGCEMVGTDHRADEWRALAAEVRKHFSGPITYNCDKYQEDNVTWWDAVDVISSSGYYPIDRLDENFERIGKVAERFGKPFVFMECGCPARAGSEYIPNNWAFGGETSPEAQEGWYQAFTDALLRYPFIRGTGWWDWSASRLYPEEDGMTNSGYCTYGKPAGEVLRSFADALKKTCSGKTQPRCLSNPNADEKTKRVFAYLSDCFGTAMLTSQMESTWMGSPDYEMDYIEKTTGKLPAIRGLDFMHNDFEGVTERAKAWDAKGGLVTICWHTGVYGSGYDESLHDDPDFSALFTPGTAEHEGMMKSWDRCAKALAELRDAGVPVLWRPFHEFDGQWFWWGKGGADSFIRLWRLMYEKFTFEYNLTNLIWVLGYSGEVKEGWYPGDAYCDIVGSDTYDNSTNKKGYEKLRSIADKPLCFHECGNVPPLERFEEDGDLWVYFMVWHTTHIMQNDPENLKAVYHHDGIITLDKLPDLK